MHFGLAIVIVIRMAYWCDVSEWYPTVMMTALENHLKRNGSKVPVGMWTVIVMRVAQ